MIFIEYKYTDDVRISKLLEKCHVSFSLTSNNEWKIISTLFIRFVFYYLCYCCITGDMLSVHL